MGERFSLLYRYSLDGMKTWTDFTDIVDSAKTSVVNQLCSTQCKSIVDTASVFLPARPSQLKADMAKALLEGKDINVQIFDLSPNPMLWDGDPMIWEDRKMLWNLSLPIFTGIVDKKSSTTIKSVPFTPSITLSLKDLSSIRLDDKVDSYVFMENRDDDRLTISKVVKHLVQLAGYECSGDTLDDADERMLPCFVVDKDNAKTYREYIDTLLFEAGGYVLDFDQYGKANIRRLPWDDKQSATARTIDDALIADGISTKFDVMDTDGVELTWSTLSESSSDQLVYQDSIQRKVENGYLQGVDVPAGGYWPEDGDVTATYQQFSADFLDKPYLIKDSRKKDEDLSIVAVRDVYAYIQATKKDGTKFEGWEFPVLPSLGMETNPTIWPTKAWYLLHNGTSDAVNLQIFNLRGRVLYRSKVTVDTTPAASKKPKEYTSTYIYSQAHAEHFTQFYWHYLNTTRFITSYTELNKGVLGETVRIGHKGLEFGQDAMVVSLETTWLNGGTKKVKTTAVGISAFNQYASSSSSTIPGRKETGNGIESVEYRYAVTRTQTAPKPEDITLTEIPTLSETDKYLWRKETTHYTDPSFPDTVVVMLAAVYGDEGEPARVATLSCDKSTVERNDRSSASADYTFTATVQGYGGVVSVIVDRVQQTLSKSGDKYVCTYRKAVKNADAITAKLLIGDKEMDSITLSVVDLTTKSVSLGAVTQLPETTPYGDIIDGDYFIAAVAFNSKGVDYEKAVPYVRYNGAWTKLTTSDDGYSEKMLQCCGDLLAANVDIPASATAIYGWFANLAAQSAVFGTLAANDAFIKLLKVYNLFVGTGSRSSGFYVEISDHREGSTVQEICFNVWYNGQKVFSVDPATGNVYMGGGFLYQASTQSIRSSSGKVVIDSSGTLTAEGANLTQASVSGIVDADVVNAKSGLFKGSIDTPAFSSLPNSTGGTTYSTQLASDKTSQYNSMANLFDSKSIESDAMFPCSSNVDSSIAFVQRVREGDGYGSNSRGSDTFSFFNASFANIGIINHEYNTYFGGYNRYSSSFEGSTPLVSVTVGSGEIFKFKNIPTAVTGLQSGQVYSDGGTLKIAP